MRRVSNGFVLGLILVLVLITQHHTVLAQTPQDVHPLTTECLAYGCYINWYCAPSTDRCFQCPRAFLGTTEEDCINSLILVGNATVAPTSTVVDAIDLEQVLVVGNTTYYTNETQRELDLENCFAECVKPKEGESCSDNTGGCDSGNFFCDYEPSSSSSGSPSGGEFEDPPPKEGICQSCKEDHRDCLTDVTIASPFGVEDCVLCNVSTCVPLHFSVTTVESITTTSNNVTVIPSNAMRGSPAAIGKGPVVNCHNLQYREETTCIPGGNDLPVDQVQQTGKICLVDDYTRNAYFISVVQKCAALGGVGVMFYQFNEDTAKDQTWFGSLSYIDSTIPSVSITHNDGKSLEALEGTTSFVIINVTDVGDACIDRQFCNDDIPCVGSSQGQYCDYKWGGGDGGDGFCHTCPTDDNGNNDPIKCFFTVGDDPGKITGQKAIESCAETCASELKFPKCKFCPENVDGFDFGLERAADEKCRFCPENDILYPDKNFPLFGPNVSCTMVQKFFDSVDVKTDAKNCKLAQMMNYVCGCSGPGYLGASTDVKQKVLVWLPRVMAILSIFGSMFIIYDTTKSREQRSKVMNQLLAVLSIFDIMGSSAYAFTTLPIPKDHEYGPIYGAHGNDATCTAQGFFIQMGTISAYMNVSLAIYYFLVIKFGWDERHVKKVRWVLFACPLGVGFIFAFAGIPYFDSLNLWCNNTSNYWPDIPVAIAIGVATIVMGMVCWFVYNKERASAKWREGNTFGKAVSKRSVKPERASLSEKVFWQSFFYLMAFYLTWPAYLGLQYAWVGGNSFTNYGWILTAATLVPLQGFWNMLVYIRPRHANRFIKSIRASLIRRTASFKETSDKSKRSWPGFRFSSDSGSARRKNVDESTQTNIQRQRHGAGSDCEQVDQDANFSPSHPTATKLAGADMPRPTSDVTGEEMKEEEQLEEP